MYHTTKIVGDFFEQEVMRLFRLVRTDPNASGILPDLVSGDNSFFVEVKASAYNNGGVINRGQLYRFDKDVDRRRFYAFAFHPISRHMQRDYPTEKKLRSALLEFLGLTFSSKITIRNCICNFFMFKIFVLVSIHYH